MDKLRTLGMAAIFVAVMFFALSLLPAAAMSFVSSVFAVLVLVGMGVYLLDRQAWWRSTYRFVYDFFHEVPMPTTEADGSPLVRGVVYNQPTSIKMRRAGYISFLAFCYTVYELKFGVSFWIQMLLGFLDVPAVLCGFALGYWAYETLIKNHEKLADQFDEIGDRVQNMSSDDVKNTLHQAAGGLTGRLANLVRGQKEPMKAESPPTSAPQQPKRSFREQMDQYTRKN